MRGLQGTVPNLVLSEHVVNKMIAAAKTYVHDETGEAMVGVVDTGANTGGVPTLYVMDTIPPDDTATVREYYTFQQGDERQYEIFTWLNANWKAYRKTLVAKLADQRRWDAPLIHIGDWHKQPGFMIAPSHGDLMSALDQIDEREEIDFLLVPIVTMGHESTTLAAPGANFLTLPDGQGNHARIDFWYIDKSMRAFLPISPTVFTADQMPPLTPPAWYIMNESRATLEYNQLEDGGYLVSPVIVWQIDDTLPLNICFIMARRGDASMYLAVTTHDYPAQAPTFYKSAFVPMNEGDDWYVVFEQAWKQAERLAMPADLTWTPETSLYDYLLALEGKSAPEQPQRKDAAP